MCFARAGCNFFHSLFSSFLCFFPSIMAVFSVSVLFCSLRYVYVLMVLISFMSAVREAFSASHFTRRWLGVCASFLHAGHSRLSLVAFMWWLNVLRCRYASLCFPGQFSVR